MNAEERAQLAAVIAEGLLGEALGEAISSVTVVAYAGCVDIVLPQQRAGEVVTDER